MSLWVINIKRLRINNPREMMMRDYTYLEGARFSVINIFRSQRFDVDRLDINWVNEEKPEFVRGLRVVDHQEGETYMTHAEDADNLIFSLAYVSNKSEAEDGTRRFDEYLAAAVTSKNYLVTDSKKKESEVSESVLH